MQQGSPAFGAPGPLIAHELPSASMPLPALFHPAYYIFSCEQILPATTHNNCK